MGNAFVTHGQVPSFADSTIPSQNPSSFPANLCVSGDTLFFAADDGIHGRELWMWRSTPDAKTQGICTLAADLLPGQRGSNPDRLTDVNGWLYFIADNTGSQKRTTMMWRHSDSDQPRPVTNRVGNPLYGGQFLGLYDDTLYFSAWRLQQQRELFVSQPGGERVPSFAVLPRAPSLGGEILRSALLSDGKLIYYSVDGMMIVDGTVDGIVDGTADRAQEFYDFFEGSNLFITGAMCTVNARVLFVGYDKEHGRELWITDGTAQGTRLVRDIAPGFASSGITSFFHPVGGEWTYFGANDSQHGMELWKTNGTLEGTTLVKDIYPGRSSGDPYGFAAVGPWVYFTAQDSEHGREIWRTDGSPEQTELVSDLYPGSQGSDPWRLTCFRDKLFFCASSLAYGEEVFLSDRTRLGADVLKDIVPGPSGSGPHNLTVFQDRLFFTCNDGIHGEELWMTDGTAAGTRLAADVYPLRFNPPSSPHDLTALNERLVFVARDADHGEELWTSDGTLDGTNVLRDIAAGPHDSSPRDLVVCGGRVFFSAETEANGRELWCTDGTQVGTTLVLDINPGKSDGAPGNLCAVADRVYFTANDGIHGQELWQSNGSVEGTKLVEDHTNGPADTHVRYAFEYGGRVFFYVEELDKTTSLWVVDAADDRVDLVLKNAGRSKDSFTTGGETTRLATASLDVGAGILNTEQLGLIRLLHPPTGELHKWEHAVVGTTTYFVCRSPQLGAELWKTDGTLKGTLPVLDIFPGPASSSPSYLTPVHKTLYFVAEHPQDGRVLWQTNGTPGDTSLVSGVSNTGLAFPFLASELATVNGALVMRSSPSLDRKTQPADNVELRFIQPDEPDSRVGDLLDDLRVGPEGSWPRQFTQVGSHVFFTADDGIHGEELWVTDGTPPGTHLVKDILVPGDLSPMGK